MLQRDGGGVGADAPYPAPDLAGEKVNSGYQHYDHKHLRTFTLGTEQFNAVQLWPRISPWSSGNETINLDIESCPHWD